MSKALSKIGILARRVGLAGAIAVGLVIGGGVSAQALAGQVDSTYISGWQVGKNTSWRTVTSSSAHQRLYTGAACRALTNAHVWGSSTYFKPSSIQWQLQRKNGLFVVAGSNKSFGCGGTGDWGTRTKGLQYSYQYNGLKHKSSDAHLDRDSYLSIDLVKIRH